MLHHDLVVIGSGAAAMAAAIRARDLGRSVLIVEAGQIGGTCVNVGCIPSKSLLAGSRRPGMELIDALEQTSTLVQELRRSKYVNLLADYGIATRTGQARIVDRNTVAVDGQPVRAEAVLIAAGARPTVPSIAGLEQAGYLTSTTAMQLTHPPRRLAVIGANAVGLELGQMLGNFGSRVTFISRRSIAPYSEPEVSAMIGQVVQEQGHEALEGAHVHGVALKNGDKVVRGLREDDEGFEVRTDEILVAVGRAPNTEGLDLDRVGIETDADGRIVVDGFQRTSVGSIYAAGDVTTQPQLVYVAAAAGAAAAQNAFASGQESLDFAALPRVIFTTPQIAAVGRTESEALAGGFAVETAVLGLDAVPRALVNRDTRGLVKLVRKAGTRRLIGASVMAESAGEVIQSAVLAIAAGLTTDELKSTWAPYLTMAEGLKLAAQAFDRDVARLSCCAA